MTVYESLQLRPKIKPLFCQWVDWQIPWSMFSVRWDKELLLDVDVEEIKYLN